jgi:hypothetical protein
MNRQAVLMSGQLKEMKQAGKQTAKHLSLTERPWISPSAHLASGLTADENGIHVTIRIDLENMGKSPATGMWILPELHMLSGRNAMESLDRSVQRMRNQVKAKVSWGQIVFPGAKQPQPVRWSLTASVESVRNAVVVDGMYSVMVIVATGYGSTVDECARHVTMVFYSLDWINPQQPMLRDMLREGVSVPMEQLSLIESPLQGPLAE